MPAPILVTGGAGFLGSWLVRCLIEAGETVRVLDLPNARWQELGGDVERFVGDIRDRDLVARAVRGCGAVCHLAGLPQLWVKPRGRLAQVNAGGTACVLVAASRAGCRRILHVSSATIWPPPGAPLCRWTNALGPYCRSKWQAERQALALARQGAPIVIVSPTLPIGPGDWSRTPPTQLLLDACRGRLAAYLDARLNLIDVRDAAAAMSRALVEGIPGERYLLGHEDLLVRDLLLRLAALSGRPAPRWRVPYPLALTVGVAAEWWANVSGGPAPAATAEGVRLTRRPLPSDPAKDLRRLGVTPRPLEATIREAVAWFRAVSWM